jgi:hypothetical protein
MELGTADDPLHGPNRPLVTGKRELSLPSSCHVLLVDDERLTRTVLSSLLRKCGYRGERPRETGLQGLCASLQRSVRAGTKI